MWDVVPNVVVAVLEMNLKGDVTLSVDELELHDEVREFTQGLCHVWEVTGST
jgi:hypothetical protein